MLEIETRYYNDGGDQDNVFCLSPAEQRNRIVGTCSVFIILILCVIASKAAIIRVWVGLGLMLMVKLGLGLIVKSNQYFPVSD